MRRLFKASHAVLVSLFAVGCMPTYKTSPTPHASRACPTRDSGTRVESVSWYFPVADDDNRELERWCRTVGPPVIDSMPNGEFGTLDERDSLAIAVWNTDAGAGDLLAFITTELELECSGTSSRLSHGSSHFVLLLQEALRRSNDIPPEPPQWVIPPPVKEDPRPTPRLDVVEVAQQCGLALMYVAGARNGHAERDGKREDKGEAILSTLPLSDFIAAELPYEAARRVAVAATIHNRSGDSLRVSSVHFISTPPPWRVLTTANTSRLRQALALVDVHRQAELDRAGAAGPGLRACYPNCTADSSVGFTISSVIAGDLNTWSNRETTLQHLFEHFPHSPPVLGEPTRGPFPTDHILFRHNAQRRTHPDQIIASTYRRIDDPYYSDHHPIIAWFRFGR